MKITRMHQIFRWCSICFICELCLLLDRLTWKGIPSFHWRRQIGAKAAAQTGRMSSFAPVACLVHKGEKLGGWGGVFRGSDLCRSVMRCDPTGRYRCFTRKPNMAVARILSNLRRFTEGRSSFPKQQRNSMAESGGNFWTKCYSGREGNLHKCWVALLSGNEGGLYSAGASR